MSRNRIRCLHCGDIIESKYRHDFQMCSCERCFVDGGQDYQRIGGDPHEIHIVLDDNSEVPMKDFYK